MFRKARYLCISVDNVSETHVNNLPSSNINETKAYTYDSYGRLTKTVTADHTNSNAESTVTYGYDSVGNRVSLTDSTGTATYTYNGLNQLTKKVDPKGTTTYTYDGRGNQISEVGPEGTLNFTYAVTGEMLSVSAGNTVIQENEYNHEGIRISKTENGTERQYIYDNGSVAYTLDNESISSANILGGYQNVVGSYIGENYYTYSKDIQGSTSSITDDSFNGKAIYEYSDFGEVTEIVEEIDNEICYTGAIHDETTGLHYMNARYYDPTNGRFISQDSYRGEINDPGQWHLYVYCANNPINYTDPSGHIAIGIPLLWKGLVYIIGGSIVIYNVAEFVRKWNEQSDEIARNLSGVGQAVKSYAKDLGRAIGQSFSRSKNKYKNNEQEVHHIVAKKAKRAAPARKIINTCGIGTENSKNKVTIKKGLHKRLHRITYYEMVNSTIRTGYDENKSKRTNKKKVEKKLKILKNYLVDLSAISPY